VSISNIIPAVVDAKIENQIKFFVNKIKITMRIPDHPL